MGLSAFLLEGFSKNFSICDDDGPDGTEVYTADLSIRLGQVVKGLRNVEPPFRAQLSREERNAAQDWDEA